MPLIVVRAVAGMDCMIADRDWVASSSLFCNYVYSYVPEFIASCSDYAALPMQSTTELSIIINTYYVTIII